MKRQHVLVIAVVALMVVLAGCASFGTDSPSDQNESNDTGDLQDTSNQSDDTETNTESDDSADTEEDTQPASSTSEDSETGDAETSPSSTADSDSDSGGSDEGNDGQLGESESATGSEETDSGGSDSESFSSGNSGSDDSSSGSSAGDSSDSNSDSTSDSDSDASDHSGDDDDSDESDRNGSTDSGDGNNDDPGDDGDDEDTNDDDPETYTLTVEADAPVTIERLSDGATTTREATDGTVEFTVIEDEYNIMADGYNDPLMSFAVDEDTTVTLQRSGSITVTVRDAATGEPIEGAEISGMCDMWYSSGDAYISGESNADGVIEAQTLTPTTCRYDTQVTADGYETASLGEINVPEDDGMTVELQPEETEESYPGLTLERTTEGIVMNNPTDDEVSLNGWIWLQDGGERIEMSGTLPPEGRVTDDNGGPYAIVNPDDEEVDSIPQQREEQRSVAI